MSWVSRIAGGLLAAVGVYVFATDLRVRWRRNRLLFPNMRLGAIDNQPTTWRFWVGGATVLLGLWLMTLR